MENDFNKVRVFTCSICRLKCVRPLKGNILPCTSCNHEFTDNEFIIDDHMNVTRQILADKFQDKRE
jgi:hypothetical protein